MTLIRHEAPTVTSLNLFKVQDEFAAQKATHEAALAKQQRSADEVKADNDKLNQREADLMNREKALTAQMAAFEAKLNKLRDVLT